MPWEISQSLPRVQNIPNDFLDLSANNFVLRDYLRPYGNCAGELCLEMVRVSPPRQQIISSCTFGRYVIDLHELEEAVSIYMSRAAEKLRRQGSVAETAYAYLRTRHRPD